MDGHRYEVSTRRTNEVDALLELAKFNNSPATYDPTPPPDLLGDEAPQPVYLTAALIREYLDHCKTAGNTHQWWNSKRRFLKWWLQKLFRIDLRRADLKRDILKPLEGATSRHQRIACLKAFYSWLRDVENGKGILTASEDPTVAGVLRVPQHAPAQLAERRAFAVKDLGKVKKELANGPRWRLDALEVLSGTGWHYSELRRFAELGKVEPLPSSQEPKKRNGKVPAGAPVAVLVTIHKGGGVHKTAVTALDAGPRAPFNPWRCGSVACPVVSRNIAEGGWPPPASRTTGSFCSRESTRLRRTSSRRDSTATGMRAALAGTTTSSCERRST